MNDTIYSLTYLNDTILLIGLEHSINWFSIPDNRIIKYINTSVVVCIFFGIMTQLFIF